MVVGGRWQRRRTEETRIRRRYSYLFSRRKKETKKEKIAKTVRLREPGQRKILDHLPHHVKSWLGLGRPSERFRPPPGGLPGGSWAPCMIPRNKLKLLGHNPNFERQARHKVEEVKAE